MRSLVMAVLLLALVPAPPPGSARSPSVQVYTTTITIPTYPYGDFLHTCHSDPYNIDYPCLDWEAYQGSNPEPAPRDYEAVVLENEWLRLTFLPGLGGRLYGITDMASGEELLYQNPVIKPNLGGWGPPEQPWWLAAGGVEWCLPVEEHGYEWALPWGYDTEVLPNGARITLWDSKANDRLRAEITIFLPANEAAFQVRPWLVNPTGSPVTFKFWHNAMLAPGAANSVGPDLRFVLPIDQVTVHSSGNFQEQEVLSWPVHGDGVDYSRLGNWDRWLGFFARPGAAEDWAGVYDGAARRGLARVFPSGGIRGVKGFAFGWRDPIDSSNWTDDGSTYVELHGGPSPTFWDSITLQPLQTLGWTETWLPVRDLPALSWANEAMAIGLEPGDNVVHLGLLSPGRHSATVKVWRRSDCTLLWQEAGVDLQPGVAAWRDLLGLEGGLEELLVSVFDGDQFLAATGDAVCWPPRSSVDLLPAVSGSTRFWVHWTGTDLGGGLAGYDIQVRDGDATAPWVDWRPDETLTGDFFQGEDGHTYAFRSRARDQWGNIEEWPANNWDDTFTTVLLQPAPVLITSAKVVQPLSVWPGDLLEFQVHLNNTGSLAASAGMSDMLPVWLELANQPWSSPGTAPPVVSGETITWHGEVPAGETVTVGFEAWLRFAPPDSVVSNTAWITDGLHPALAVRAVARVGRRVYVPLVWR